MMTCRDNAMRVQANELWKENLYDYIIYWLKVINLLLIAETRMGLHSNS